MKVMLCGELESKDSGLDLAALRAWLAARRPDTEIRVTRDPCNRPERWLGGLGPGNRLVLGVCATIEDRRELETRVRRMGLDPLGIEILDLGTYCVLAHPRPEATRKAGVLLDAALARVGRFPGSGPEHLRPALSWNGAMTRRSLFTLPPPRYDAVPAIREGACLGSRGCRVCATTCPKGAIVADAGGVALDKTQCTACGACVSECPAGAIEFPGASLPELEAQVAKLLGAAAHPGPPAVLFLCRRAAPALRDLAARGITYAPSWYPVEVPCLGTVSPSWVLGTLAHGASAVALLPCGRDDCRFGNRDVVARRVEYCREVVGRTGGARDAVRLLDPLDDEAFARGLVLSPDSVLARADASRPAPRFGRGQGAANLRDLAARLDHTLDGFVHPDSPFGVVTLTSGCTACGACVTACPTGALHLERGDAEVSISFDGARCVACDGCVPVCPESVVRLDRRTDLEALARGRHVLHHDREARCERCGAPVAAHALLERMRAVLGNDALIADVARYCPACRGTL